MAELRAAIEQGGGALPTPSPQLLQRLNGLQDSVQAWLPQAAPLSVADALRLCANANASTDQDWSSIAPQLEQALDELIAAREREGQRLATMPYNRVAQLRALAGRATPWCPGSWSSSASASWSAGKTPWPWPMAPWHRKQRSDRALTEATAFAIRIDVAEEITRLQSHPRRD